MRLSRYVNFSRSFFRTVNKLAMRERQEYRSVIPGKDICFSFRHGANAGPGAQRAPTAWIGPFCSSGKVSGK